MFQDILVSGLINGGVYALLAIGFSLIFGVARIVNIAHTAFYMLASYALYGMLVIGGMPLVLAIPLAVVAVVALSLVCYKLVIEPVRKRGLVALLKTMRPLEEAFPDIDNAVPAPEKVP